MFKRISNWFRKKPQTKASYIGAIAGAIAVPVAVFAAWVALSEHRLNRQLAHRAEVEKVEIQFDGGVTCSSDYKTRFSIMPKNSMSNADKVIMATRWPIIVSNNGENTVSLVAHEAWSRIHGGKRNIQTNILDSMGQHISLPVVLPAGESVRLFLEVPIHIPTSVFDLVKDLPIFSTDFAPDQLDNYLCGKHGIDFYGNSLRYAEKVGGVGPERAPFHLFGYDLDGNLRQDLMQADQVMLEFRTGRDKYFTARAIYYDEPTFKPTEVKYLPQGRPAIIPVHLEPIDSLPKLEDAPAQK
jgi:hypothetical protein